MLRPCLFASLLTVAGFSVVSAADVVVLVTPKCGLDPKTVDLGANTGTAPYHYLNPAPAVFAEATSVKELKVKGETIVVELAATTAKPGTRTESFTLDGAKGSTPVTYKTVFLSQPYKLWFIKAPGAEPVKMLEGTLSGEGSEVKRLEGSRVEIAKLAPEALIRKGMADIHRDRIAHMMQYPFGEKILAGKPLTLTSSQLLNTRAMPVEVPKPNQFFKPKKVTYGPKGDATVEIDLHNRLPVRVTGYVNRTRTMAELDIEMAFLKAKQKTNLEDFATFDLQPDEKKTVTINVPADFVTKAKLTSLSYIRLGDFNLSPPPKK